MTLLYNEASKRFAGAIVLGGLYVRKFNQNRMKRALSLHDLHNLINKPQENNLPVPLLGHEVPSEDKDRVPGTESESE